MFRFDQLVGQEVAARSLGRALTRGQLAHAYLIHGESGLGLELAALALARAALCAETAAEPCDDCPGCRKSAQLDHPDLRILLPLPAGPSGREEDDPADHHSEKVLEAFKQFRENPWVAPEVAGGRQLLVAQARHLKRWAQLKSYEGGQRVAVVWQAERMGVQAQNALLKLLEEPPDQLLLLLTSEAPERLLPTILSRCQSLRLRPAREETLAERLGAEPWADGLRDGDGAITPSQLARMAAGNMGRAREIAESLGDGGAKSDLWRPEAFLRDLLGKPEWLHARIVALEESKDRLQVGRLLADVQTWLQDAELLRELPGEAGAPLVRHAHQLEALERFASRFRLLRPDETAAELETARRLCERNVHLFILLTTLVQRLLAGIAPIGRQAS